MSDETRKSKITRTDDPDGTVNVSFSFSPRDLREMSTRQVEDFRSGLTLLVGSMRPDDYFLDPKGGQFGILGRVHLIQLDEELSTILRDAGEPA